MMIDFICRNFGTIFVSLALTAAVLLAVRKLYKDRRSGKNSCGGSCGNCPYSSGCGKDRK